MISSLMCETPPPESLMCETPPTESLMRDKQQRRKSLMRVTPQQEHAHVKPQS